MDQSLSQTYGEDLRQGMATHSQHVWTLLDCDGKLVVGAGYHLVNRINHRITLAIRGKMGASVFRIESITINEERQTP
jgi:predicted nucleotide-binding protein (sugar kinase/HSP70/actin superfamily)